MALALWTGSSIAFCMVTLGRKHCTTLYCIDIIRGTCILAYCSLIAGKCSRKSGTVIVLAASMPVAAQFLPHYHILVAHDLGTEQAASGKHTRHAAIMRLEGVGGCQRGVDCYNRCMTVLLLVRCLIVIRVDAWRLRWLCVRLACIYGNGDSMRVQVMCLTLVMTQQAHILL
jgi:hypothetical protein